MGSTLSREGGLPLNPFNGIESKIMGVDFEGGSKM